MSGIDRIGRSNYNRSVIIVRRLHSKEAKNVKKRHLLFVLIITVFLPSVSLALEPTTIGVGGANLTVEVADDPLERSLGLMYRESLPENRGMLFVYPDEQPRAFWMKNTRIPLSIAFADAGGTIIAIMDMIPDDGRTRYRSPGPAKYALEVNQGWFENNGVKVGSELRLK